MPVGPLELGIILVIIIIIFGAGKLPEIGGALGKGIREFKDSASDEDEADTVIESTEAAKPVESSSSEPVKEEL